MPEADPGQQKLSVCDLHIVTEKCIVGSRELHTPGRSSKLRWAAEIDPEWTPAHNFRDCRNVDRQVVYLTRLID